MKHEEQQRENVFKKWANERNLQANLEEYENDLPDQRLSHSDIQKFCPLCY